MPSHAPFSGCPFCNESIQSSVFYETRDFMAVFNIAPVLPGHSLVIPRAHHTSILSLSDEELTDFFKTARSALLILMKAFHTEAFDWSIQEKPEAGQTIEHLHLHIVPRVMDDLLHPGTLVSARSAQRCGYDRQPEQTPPDGRGNEDHRG